LSFTGQSVTGLAGRALIENSDPGFKKFDAANAWWRLLQRATGWSALKGAADLQSAGGKQVIEVVSADRMSAALWFVLVLIV